MFAGAKVLQELRDTAGILPECVRDKDTDFDSGTSRLVMPDAKKPGAGSPFICRDNAQAGCYDTDVDQMVARPSITKSQTDFDRM